jgi:hypothetical protein
MVHTAGLTGRQGMLTPWHLILPLVSPGVRVGVIFWICISYGIYKTDHCSLYYFFILMDKRWQFGVKDGDIHKLNIILILEFFEIQSRGPRWADIWILDRNSKRSQRLLSASRKSTIPDFLRQILIFRKIYTHVKSICILESLKMALKVPLAIKWF